MEYHCCFSERAGQYFREDDLKLQFSVAGELTDYERDLCGGKVIHFPAFLKNNGFQHQLLNRSVVATVCKYLLQQVSCSSDPVTVVAAANALSYQITSGVAWAPDRSLLLLVALNWGLSEQYLPPDFDKSDLTGLTKRASERCTCEHPQLLHVEQTISCLTELLRPEAEWTVVALDTLFMLLVNMLMDGHMQTLLLTPQLVRCLQQLVNIYDANTWYNEDKLLDLVEQLGAVPRSAQLHVLSSLPVTGQRCQNLRRIAAYYHLQAAVNATDIDLPNSITVEDVLAKVPPESFPCSTPEDVEHFFMVLSFIDMAVGSERPPRPQRAKLRELQMRIQPDVDRVKENLEQRGLVTIRLKELMTRLNSKWRYMVEDSLIQTTLDSFGSQ